MTVPLIHVGWKLTALHFVDQTGRTEALFHPGFSMAFRVYATDEGLL